MIFTCRGSVSWSNLSPEDFGSNLPIPQTIKGQLISKCPFGVFKSPKKPTNFSRISALASKKRSNQKSSVGESN